MSTNSKAPVNDYDDVLDLRPLCDCDSTVVLESALEALAELRGIDSNHPAVRLHLLSSLAIQTQALLPATMLDADSLGYNINEIIILLNLA